MAVFKNARIYNGEYRLDTDANQVNLGYEAEQLDDTVFNDDTRSNAGGLKVITIGASGFWNATSDEDRDKVLFDDIGQSDVPVLVAANAAANGDECYFTRCVGSEYSVGGAVGELLTFDYSAASRAEPLIRGQILNESTETSSGNSAAVQLGTVGADETLYGILSVTNSGGDSSQTLDVTITGDTSSGGAFGTTHLTFSQVTTSITALWQTKAGSISDDWFRAEWTIGGTGSPTFDFIVAAGIA